MSTVPDRLGPYRMLHRLATGVTTETFRAQDTTHGRLVACRVVRADLSGDRRFRSDFLAALDRVAALNHPNVVPVHRWSEIDGRLIVELGLVDGPDLGTVRRNGPMTPDAAVAMIEQVAAGLAAAHRAGFAHGALDASHVLLSSRAGYADVVRLVGFSLDPHRPRAVDVSALGSLLSGLTETPARLRAVLAGPIGRGDDPVALARAARIAISPRRTRLRLVAVALAAVLVVTGGVAAAVSSDPADTGPRELARVSVPGGAENIRIAPDGHTALARRDGSISVVDLTRSTVVTTIAAESGDAVPGPPVATRMVVLPNGTADDRSARTVDVSTGAIGPPLPLPTAGSDLSALDPAGNTMVVVAGGSDRRGWEVGDVLLDGSTTLGPPRRLTGDPGAPTAVAAGPGGDLVAISALSGATTVFDRTGRQVARVVEGSTTLAFDPDGSRLRLLRSGELLTLDVATGALHRRSLPQQYVNTRRGDLMTVEPDGSVRILPGIDAYVVRPDGTPVVFRIGAYTTAAVHPDGARAVLADGGGLRIVELA